MEDETQVKLLETLPKEEKRVHFAQDAKEHEEYYYSLQAQYQSEKRQKRVWYAITALSLSVLAAIAIIAVFRAVEEAVEQPHEKPAFPTEYEASITLHMPYINLVEPIYVHFKEATGMQKLSHYDGMDVYIFNKTGTSYQIIPTGYNRTCFRIGTPPLQHVFPNLTMFKPHPGITRVNGVDCLSWKYQIPGSTPSSEGMLGIYTFYVNAVTNEPIRYHYIGHNIMFGGSHMDEYYIDYNYIRKESIPDVIFQELPTLMSCDTAQDWSSKTPTKDLKMLFPEGEQTKHKEFEEFRRKYAKRYDNLNETTLRSTNFHHNLRYINSMNRKNLPYVLGVNHLADFSHEERIHLFSHRNTVKRPANNHAPNVHTIYEGSLSEPLKVDWRKRGAVTKVKDQGMCGSCWSFGTTGTLEGALFRKSGKLVELSEQNLMDCSWDEGNRACDGGLDFQAYNWIIKNGGLEATSTYGTYRNDPGYCHFNKSRAAVQVEGFTNITSMAGLNDALIHIGPVSVSIDATLPSFYFYAGGFYDDADCKSSADDLDQSVLAVGYITHNHERYTIIKNSWSTHWGQNGYIFVKQKNNICGVATAATYPNLRS